jgi:hypothetical protein
MNPSTSELSRTHPCFRPNASPPSSAQQPSLTTEIHYFEVDNLPEDYPYDITPTTRKKAQDHVFYLIPFYRIKGIGPPPTDLAGTNASDVYLDLFPGAYAAYGKTVNGWQRWYDPQPTAKLEETLVRHPHFLRNKKRTRSLWCSNSAGVSWFSPGTVARNQKRAKELGLVTQDANKTQEVRWREAAAVIEDSLEAERAFKERALRVQCRIPSPLTPMPNSRPASPVGKKRKRRSSSAELSELDDTETLLNLVRESVRLLKEENEERAAEVSQLERKVAVKLEDGAEGPKSFMEWGNEVISGAFYRPSF